jgi:hypothetical protein
MDRPETIAVSRRRARSRGAAAAALTIAATGGAFTVAVLAPADAAQAQTSGQRSPYIVEVALAQTGSSRAMASADLPASTRAVMLRASTMLQAAQARQSGAAYGARQSYQAATSALRQALAAGRFTPTGTGTGDALTGLPVSSTQVAEDIRTLKSAMQGATPAQSAALQRVVSLYATGAKEFFTGQLRDALFSTDNNTGGAIVIRGSRQPSNGAVAAGFGGASSALTGRTVTPRGAQQAGGVIQSNGSVVPVAAAPPVPGLAPGAPTPAPATGPGGVGVQEAPPAPLSPVVPGNGVNTVAPAAPVVVPVTPVAPVAPVDPPPQQ